MDRTPFDELEEHIAHKVRGIVDDHPLTSGLSEVARRNMAYCAGGSAISALTREEIEATQWSRQRPPPPEPSVPFRKG